MASDNSSIKALAKEILETPFYEKANPETAALLVLPGQQNYRISEGVKNWPEKAKHLWVAGTRADPFYTRKDIMEIISNVRGEIFDPSNIENGGWANNTVDQMKWASELLKKNPQIDHLAITTAAYHLSRCILTFLQTMEKQGIERRVISPIPIVHPSGPDLKGPDFAGEMKKISLYQEKGDIASEEMWRSYSEWRNNQ